MRHSSVGMIAAILVRSPDHALGGLDVVAHLRRGSKIAIESLGIAWRVRPRQNTARCAGPFRRPTRAMPRVSGYPSPRPSSKPPAARALTNAELAKRAMEAAAPLLHFMNSLAS